MNIDALKPLVTEFQNSLDYGNCVFAKLTVEEIEQKLDVSTKGWDPMVLHFVQECLQQPGAGCELLSVDFVFNPPITFSLGHFVPVEDVTPRRRMTKGPVSKKMQAGGFERKRNRTVAQILAQEFDSLIVNGDQSTADIVNVKTGKVSEMVDFYDIQEGFLLEMEPTFDDLLTYIREGETMMCGGA